MQQIAPITAEHYTTIRIDGIQKQQTICSGKKPIVKLRGVNKVTFEEQFNQFFLSDKEELPLIEVEELPEYQELLKFGGEDES